jgi:hypothetical protein
MTTPARQLQLINAQNFVVKTSAGKTMVLEQLSFVA